MRLAGQDWVLYTFFHFPDPDCSGSGSTSVPGGGAILGAGLGAVVGLSARKWLATSSDVVASTVLAVGFSVVVIISLTVAPSFNALPPALTAVAVPLKIIDDKSATLRELYHRFPDRVGRDLETRGSWILVQIESGLDRRKNQSRHQFDVTKLFYECQRVG